MVFLGLTNWQQSKEGVYYVFNVSQCQMANCSTWQLKQIPVSLRAICIMKKNYPCLFPIWHNFCPFLKQNHLGSVRLLPAAGTLPTCFRRIPWQHGSEWTGRDTPLAQPRTAVCLNRKRALQLHRMCVQVGGWSGEKRNLASTNIEGSAHKLISGICVTWSDVNRRKL